MRKIIITFMIAILCSGIVLAASNETIKESPFLPVSPRVMAQGGSFMAVANGYESLFYNPAGFANTKFSLTLASLAATVYLNPMVIQQLATIALPAIQGTSEITDDDLGTMLDLMNDQITSGGLGVNVSSGFGLVAGGVGLGGALTLDFNLFGGRNMLDVSGDVVGTLGFVAGFAQDFNLLGMVWNVGLDVRPMYRIHSILENRYAIEMAAAAMAGNLDTVFEQLYANQALSGLGVGFDAGAIVEMGPLQFAISMRDILGTKFEYFKNPMSVVLDAIVAGDNIPETEAATDYDYVIPMNVSAGAALNIDFLRPFLGLQLHGDIQDVIGVIVDKRTPWTLLHIGAEATLLDFIKFRAGFNQGYITFGAGLHLLILDLNVAAFTRELGQHIADQPNSGVTLELAIRI